MVGEIETKSLFLSLNPLIHLWSVLLGDIFTMKRRQFNETNKEGIKRKKMNIFHDQNSFDNIYGNFDFLFLIEKNRRISFN